MNESCSDLYEKYKKFSYSFMAPKIEKYLHYFESLTLDMKKAGLTMSLEEYMSIAFMTSLLVFVVEFPLVFIITLFIPGFSPIMGIIFSFSLSMVFSLAIFFFFYIYPSMVASSKKRKIDITLPFATLYMATISGSNAPAKSIFKIVSKFDEYGEVTKELREIVKNMEIFGMGLNEAIMKVANKTPSDEFKELLWGIETTISSGGNLSEYLHGKARALMDTYRRMMNEYSKKISLLIEIYLTLIIIGSILVVVLTSVMGLFGGEMMDTIILIQFFVTFFGLPIISFIFIIILKYMSPGGGSK